MRRFLTLLIGMFLLVSPEMGCSSMTLGSYVTNTPTQMLFHLPSNPPVGSKSITPSKTNTHTSQSSIFPTLAYSVTPNLSFTFTPTLNPLACVPTDAKIEYGLVRWIPDGDTIVVDILGRLHTVQYLGIEAPGYIGTTEYRGPTSARYNEKLARNQLVRMVGDGLDRDSSGQLLRYVFVGDRFLNYELVRQGLAFVVRKPEIACEKTFIQAEEMAKQEVLGIWEATRTPHRTSTPTSTLSATILPGTLLPSVSPDQFTPTYTLTPIHSPSSTISPTPTLTPTVTYSISPTPTITETTTLTTTSHLHVVVTAYGFVHDTYEHVEISKGASHVIHLSDPYTSFTSCPDLAEQARFTSD